MYKKLLVLVITYLLLSLGITNIAYADNKVGIIIFKYDNNFMALMRKDINNLTKNIKNTSFLMNDAQNSQSIQNDQADVLLSKGVKVLAVNLVDPSAADTIINKAKQDDVPVIFFNKDPGAKSINSYDKAYFIGTEPKESGIIQAEMIAKQWKANPSWDLNKDGKIQYVLLKGEPGHPDAEDRTKYVIEELQKQGLEIEQVFLDTAMWDTALAKDKTDAWFSSPKGNSIELIISNNDAMALGALETTRANGKKIPIFTIDALPEVLQLVNKGEIAGTVLNDTYTQAKTLVELSTNLADNKPALEGTDWKMDNRIIRIPYIAIDRSNLDQFIK